MKISVRKLFGRFDYDFELGNITESGIAILTGPNGFGKTTILECINAISNSDLLFFSDLKFESFEVVKEETEERIYIQKLADGLKINEIEISDKDISFLSKGVINRRMAIRNNNAQGNFMFDRKYNNDSLSLVLNLMQKIFGKIQYVKEQRLNENEDGKILTNRQSDGKSIYHKDLLRGVNSIPEKLIRRMQVLNFKYSQLSNALDSTFPKRLFNLQQGITKEQFEREMQQMQEKIEKLHLNGISKIEKLDVTEFKVEDARALKVYFEDFNQKYQVYEEIIEQLELFREIVNNRFRFKYLEITAEQGMIVKDRDTGERIRLNSLSSGEQEILILYYTLLFETPEGMMVLIDEPEISLHIAWQRMFAKDLKRIVQLKKIYTILATHSPQMIFGNQNIQYDLGEMYKNGLN